jgi:hypothetical protein
MSDNNEPAFIIVIPCLRMLFPVVTKVYHHESNDLDEHNFFETRELQYQQVKAR